MIKLLLQAISWSSLITWAGFMGVRAILECKETVQVVSWFILVIIGILAMVFNYKDYKNESGS